MNYPVWPESGSSAGPPGFSRSSNVRPSPDDPAGKSPSKFNGQNSSGGRSNNEVQQEGSKYATLTATPAFSEEENLLKAAAHFLSSGQSGRHYVRDYSSTMGYPNPAGTVAVSTPSSSYNCHPTGQQSRNIAEAAGRTGLIDTSSSGGGGMANGTANHPLLSPCGAMEEASSPGSAANGQISYLGALQNPASLTQLGFSNHYLLSKDGAGLAAAAAAAAHHAAQQHHQVMNSSSNSGSSKKKEPKPGSDVRSFICQVCGRGFKQKATLAQHERTHTDERPFDCPDCHKRFRQQSHLVQHIRIHSDERPYACTYCDKAFRQKAILNQHIRIHTGEKPYVCPQCTKCFRQKAILNQHIRTHSGKRPYSCPDSKCKKKFVDQVSMEKHFKKHIEDDQNQLLAEARGLIGANSGGGGSGGAGGGGAITSPSSAADRINHNAKGLLRVKLDRPPSTFNRISQDRATSPFPINMMMIRGQQQPNNNNSPGRSNELATQQEVNSYHHHQAVAAAAAAASGPYQFVPFPHRPYHYDLLGLGSMGQSIYGGNNKMMEQAASTKYRESLDVNNQMSNQVVEPNNVAGNNTYSTPVNSTANSKGDGGP